MKRERRGLIQGASLLVTTTNDPFQPMRLYYSTANRHSASGRLRTLECLAEVPDEHCWQWLFQAEAASLRFGAGYEDASQDRRPVILGRICFPTNGSMVLETDSVARAIGAARFFAPCLGFECTAIRCRIVNRLFSAEEGTVGELMKVLDRNVTVVDPREAEVMLGREFQGARTKEDIGRVAAESLERRLRSN